MIIRNNIDKDNKTNHITMRDHLDKRVDRNIIIIKSSNMWPSMTNMNEIMGRLMGLIKGVVTNLIGASPNQTDKRMFYMIK